MFGWFSSLVRTLVAQPHVARVLKDILGNVRFQALALIVLGREDVTPSELLSSLLILAIISLVSLSLVPKARLTCWGWWYFFASRDKTMEKPTDVEIDYEKATRKMVVFIRHGESEWNQVFNKGPVLVRPLKFIRAIFYEALMLLKPDSIFLDSPLSSVGIQQAFDLMTFLASQPEGFAEGRRSPSMSCSELQIEDIVSIIRGDAGDSIVASSILRRAVSTGVLGLTPRLLKTKPADKIQLMTSLQEISRNVDTLSLTPRSSAPEAPRKESSMKQMGDLVSFFYRTRISTMANKGNKTLKMKARDRQKEFTTWLFKQQRDAIIVCGHSLWFREFFRSYLPKGCTHEAKTSKMANCGVVAFDIYKTDLEPQVLRIRPESITPIYLGFEGKQRKRKEA